MRGCAALLGGNWNNGSNAGSRCSNWNNGPSNSNNNIGGRGACDDPSLHSAVGAMGRPYGQPLFPASANTHQGRP